MDPTPQQQEIIKLDLKKGESCRVLSGPGSGKTTTSFQVILQNPTKRFLYICFNSKGAKEAEEKAQKLGAFNVRASTIHGLAGKEKREFEAAGKFTQKLHIKDFQQRFGIDHIEAQRVINTIKAFCMSDSDAITSKHVAVKRGAEEADPLTEALRTKILDISRKAWEAMVNLNDPFSVSFDEYLKVFALKHQVIQGYDAIILDEAQDSNAVTLGILEDQRDHHAVYTIGDSAQSIYTWRGAVNGMLRFPTDHQLYLTESFRFGKEVAKVANLLLKNYHKAKYEVIGHKTNDCIGRIPLEKPHTLIARTNAKLLETAITYSTLGKKIHFVGTTAAENFDPSVPYRFNDAMEVWNLWKREPQRLKNPYFRNFANYEELKQIAAGDINGETESGDSIKGDKELERLCRLVEKHGDSLPNLLERIKLNCTHQNTADITLTTAHRSKGLEWPHVRLEDDFADIVVRDKVEDPETHQVVEGPPRLAILGTDIEPDEINLLFVAATRAQQRLHINDQIRELLRHPELSIEFPADTIQETGIATYTPPVIEATNSSAPKKREDTSPLLRIPFAKKDEAQETARKAGGRLKWEPLPKLWKWAHPKKAQVPTELKGYLINPEPPTPEVG
jgi:superfamily I DNA/RNA helicase